MTFRQEVPDDPSVDVTFDYQVEGTTFTAEDTTDLTDSEILQTTWWLYEPDNADNIYDRVDDQRSVTWDGLQRGREYEVSYVVYLEDTYEWGFSEAVFKIEEEKSGMGMAGAVVLAVLVLFFLYVYREEDLSAGVGN